MSKSPLKPWRALSDCETIHALRTAWMGTFQQHLCVYHDKQHFADITNMIYRGLTLQSCCCGTEYGLEAHGAEAPPPPHDYQRQCETQQASGLSSICV